MRILQLARSRSFNVALIEYTLALEARIGTIVSESDATIQMFAELNCGAYNLPLETSVSEEHTLWKEHAYGFIAYEGGRAVATATAIINDGCIFLFLVGMKSPSCGLHAGSI